jgi:hypothetical protein
MVMGLDMYLYGKLDQLCWWNTDAAEKRDGQTISQITVNLGYWRKHPDLHGYMVREFGDNKDECQDIYLNQESVVKIIDAIKGNELAWGTEGFFFGKSVQPDEEGFIEQKEDDLKQWIAALDWLRARKKQALSLKDVTSDKPPVWAPSIVYQASW